MAGNGNFGFDPGVLAVGINSVSRAVSDMTTVKQQVGNLADQIPLVNDSTSGRTLESRFWEWNGHFQKLTNALDTLNARLMATSQANMQTSEDADVTTR